MSKDIPIIFSGPMVRALLEGRKTQTRRIAVVSRKLSEESSPGKYSSRTKLMDSPWKRTAIGARLWVRERAWFDKEIIDAVGCRRCFFEGGEVRFEDGRFGNSPGHSGSYTEEVLNLNSSLKLRPSIHMPRWASRISLVVTSVKVERLNDISEADCFAEGVTGEITTEGTGETRPFGPAALMNFGALWERLNGEGSWLANPFVVAITFRVIKANIDAPEARAAA